MKKILIVITTEFVYYGGLTNVMMNYYKALNKDGLHIDFACGLPAAEPRISEEQK